MAKILILFYSRSGRTKKLAYILKEKLNSDIIEITDDLKREGFFGLMRTMLQITRNKDFEIFPKKIPFEQYDVVVIGSPVWGGTLSSPIQKLYTQNKDKLNKTVKTAIFVSCLGGLSEIGSNLASQIIGTTEAQPNPKLLQITKKEMNSPESERKIAKFVEAVL